MSWQKEEATAARGRWLLPMMLSLALVLLVAVACGGEGGETPTETPAVRETPSDGGEAAETPAAQETPTATAAPDAEDTPTDGVTSVWKGIYVPRDGGLGGTFCLELEQSDSKLSGALYLNAELAGSLTGEADGDEITFSLATGATYNGILLEDKAAGTWEGPGPGNAEAGDWRTAKGKPGDCS